METVEHYVALDDDSKMNTLRDCYREPAAELMDQLEHELLAAETDEFLKVEIAKTLSRFRHESEHTKNTMMTMIVDHYAENDEMALSIAADELMFFDLTPDDFEKIYTMMVSSGYQDLDMIDLTPSLIRLLATKENLARGAEQWLRKLGRMDRYARSVSVWLNDEL